MQSNARAQEEAQLREQEYIKQSEVLSSRLRDSETKAAESMAASTLDHERLHAALTEERQRADAAAAQVAASTRRMRREVEVRDARLRVAYMGRSVWT